MAITYIQIISLLQERLICIGRERKWGDEKWIKIKGF